MRNFLRRWLGIESLTHKFHVYRVDTNKNLQALSSKRDEEILQAIAELQERMKEMDEVIASYQRFKSTSLDSASKQHFIRSWVQFRAKVENMKEQEGENAV